MRKMLLSLAAVAGATAFAAPASAQWYPGQGYGSPYGYGYNWGQARSVRARINAIQRQIEFLANRGQISPPNAGRLLEDTRRLEWSIRYARDPYQLRNAEVRLNIIEQRVRYSSMNRYGYGGYGGYDRDYDDR